MDESDFSDEYNEGDEGHVEILDPDNPANELAILERDYNAVMTELEAESDTLKFSDEYTKLYETLYETKNSQIGLQSQLDEVVKMLYNREEKLEIAYNLAETDQKTITELKSQIQHAWRLTDSAHAREQNAQEIIDNLRKQAEVLNAEIAFQNKMKETDEGSLEISKNKDELERQRDRLITEVNQLQIKLTNALGYQEELERKNSQADLKINEIYGQLEDLQLEVERQKKAREEVEDDMNGLKLKLEDKDVEINELKALVNGNIKQIYRLEAETRENKTSFDKVAREAEVIALKQTKLMEEYNIVVQEVEASKTKLQTKLQDLKTSELEISRLKNDLVKTTKLKEMLEKRVIISNHEKEEISEDRNKLRQRIAIFEREIEDYKKTLDTDKRTIETVTKEKDAMSKVYAKQQSVSKEQTKLIQIQEHSKKKLEAELDNFFIEINKHKKTITSLEHDRDRLLYEEQEMKKTIEERMDEIKIKKGTIFDLKKNLVEQENKMRQQMNMFETIRADRNALQKALQESSCESGELKIKLKIALHQVEQLKEDISMREKVLIKEENIMRKIVKEKENLKIELDSSLEQVRGLRVEIKEMKEEEKRLHKSLLANEREIREQAKDLEQLMNERDILGSQLVRRNDEIALMNEKIKILETTLTRGEMQYDQRLTDIKLLKIEVKRLRQEKNILTKSMHNMLDLRQEIFRLERDLTRYRLKCRALEEEMKNPLNVHRWRKLEGSDPDVLKLIQKIQILQKRLLQQASESIERERQLKEAERLYLNLRQVVQKQPSPGVQEELIKTQRALKSRGDKLKSLVSELNMAELRTAEYKNEFQRVSDELTALKKKYLEEKKANRGKRQATLSSREVNRNSRSSISLADIGYNKIPMKMSKVVEVAADCLESVVSAIKGGADRLELCSSLTEGGLTPTPGLLIEVQKINSVKIPIFCLLRCRAGNFVYTPQEIEVMKEDVKILRRHGADGFVFGALEENGDVNMKMCREIIKTCYPLPVTFHRAFDFCRRPTIEIEVIIDLGFQRVLTSGKQENALLGVKLIKKLIEQVGNRIIIMPGGGITKENVGMIVEQTEANEIHGAFKTVKEIVNVPPTEESNLKLEVSEFLYVVDQPHLEEVNNIFKTI